MYSINKIYPWYLVFLGVIPVFTAVVLDHPTIGAWLVVVGVCFAILMFFISFRIWFDE
tara:strand:- start:1954 stop:2127 length:174 start_codon:yes stop_codon:yes gene_type:complete